MSTDERAPFEIHSARWYEKPLDYTMVIYETDKESHITAEPQSALRKEEVPPRPLRASCCMRAAEISP